MLCLATDLGMGFPFEHGIHSTLIGMRLADRLGVDPETASQTYYACPLMYVGCTADAEIAAELFRGSMATQFVPSIFGSRRQLMAGITRSIADPERAGPVRLAQVARPAAEGGDDEHSARHRAVRGRRDADRATGVAPSCAESLPTAHRAVGWQEPAPSCRTRGYSPPVTDYAWLREMPPSSRFLAARTVRVRSSESVPGIRSTRR